jgi:hypothetical protein
VRAIVRQKRYITTPVIRLSVSVAVRLAKPNNFDGGEAAETRALVSSSAGLSAGKKERAVTMGRAALSQPAFAALPGLGGATELCHGPNSHHNSTACRLSTLSTNFFPRTTLSIPPPWATTEASETD